MHSHDIGILGTGRMGVRLARLFADNGHGVLLGSRPPACAAQIARGLRRARIAGGSSEEAAGAPVVIPAMFLRAGMLDTLEPLRAQLSGKIVVDITNPFNERMTLFSAQLGQSLGYFPRMNWRLLGDPWRPGQADALHDLIAV